MENLLESLNQEQFKATTHKDGPLLIVAGAGTGKTTVITQRIAYLVEQGLAKSDEILALTFTEKAAQEMEERVDKLLPMGYLDLWISTFHSFGERILKEHGLEIGLPGGFKLLNEFEQWILVKKNLDKFNLDYYRPLGNPTKFIHSLIKHFSRAKDENISPAEYLEYAEELKENIDGMLSGKKVKSQKSKVKSLTNLNTEDNEILTQEVNRIYEVANAYHIYQQLLLDNDALDFGDLINYSLKLFKERPKILEKYRNQFKYILLDEFQDTNLAQYELIKLLAAPKNNLVVVGDDDQSIYKFRGASVSNILQFKKDYPKSEEIFLVKNYRNKQNILDLSYGFIQQNNPNRLEYQLSKGSKLNKKLIAQEKGEGTIEVIEGSDLDAEVRSVIEKIAELKTKDKKSTWNDFAILVRANETAKSFCTILDVAGLPYQFLSSRGLYSKPIIIDVVSYLKLLDDYHESIAMFRILSLSIFEFSHAELVNFNYLAKKKSWSLYSVIKSAGGKLGEEVQKKIAKVLKLIDKHTAMAKIKNASEIIVDFLESSGYLKYLVEKDEQKGRESIQYLNNFIKRVKEFENANDEKNIRAFLGELQMEIEAGEEGVLPVDWESGPEAVKVMTIHGAKGLEFKYVFIVNMVDKRFPTIERKEPILIPDALIKEILPEGDVHLEEERRLFYVAVTRAKEGLYFSWAPDYGGARKKKPSRFLVETGLIEQKKGKISKNEQEEENKISNFQFPISKQIQNSNDKNNQNAKAGAYSMPSYYSYTQLTAFKNCPYQYYFAHILKVPTKSKQVFSFGQTMHLTLQKVYERINEKKGFGQGDLFGGSEKNKRSLNITLDEIFDIYKESWIDDWYDNEKSKIEYKKKGKEILKEYYKKHKDNWPQVISLEQGINLKIGGRRIYGKIDRVDDLGEKGIQIVDYKTGQAKEKEKIGIDEKEQLLIYQMATRQAMDKNISNLQFYYLDNNSEINFLGTDKELQEMEEKIIERIEEIEKSAKTGVFLPKPGVLCKFCDFREICEYRKN